MLHTHVENAPEIYSTLQSSSHGSNHRCLETRTVHDTVPKSIIPPPPPVPMSFHTREWKLDQSDKEFHLLWHATMQTGRQP